MAMPGGSSTATFWDQGEDVSVEVNQRALIDKILARYSGEFTIFRELLQNADDAGAKTVRIRFHTAEAVAGQSSSSAPPPDLKTAKIARYVVLNDGVPFRPQDWNRLRKIAEGNPDDDKIGAFGVGFYALFSITESPMVESGDRFMGFYWKDGKDQLFARAGQLPEGHELGESAGPSATGHPWTRFTMDLRDPAPVERPLEFARFLVTSLTFMQNIRRVEMWVDDKRALEVGKDVGVTETVNAKAMMPGRGDRRATGSTSPQGVMHVDHVEVTAVKMQANLTRWLHQSGLTPPPLPILRPAAIGRAAGGFASMLSSALFSRGSSATTSASRELPAPTQPVADPHEILSHESSLRIFAADVLVQVDRNLGRELERATKKPPPKRTKLQLIFSPATEGEQDAKAAVDGAEIFAGLKPDLAGERNAKIFIGQATAQTTGIAGHIAARFIPTVERESIDLQDRHVAIWNKELLYVGGYISRVIYELEMADIATIWQASSVGIAGPDPSVRSWLTRRGLHALRFFTFHGSTPSSLVSKSMELAFFSSFGTTSLPIISSNGILSADKVRCPQPQLRAFLPDLAILPDSVSTSADLMVARLQERGLLSEISLDDVIRELARTPLNEEQMLACLRWWSSLVNMPEYDVSLRARFLEAAVLSYEEEGKQRILPLSMVRTFLNPSNVPSDMPLPPFNLPYQISKQLSANDLRFNFDWNELTVASWISYVTDPSLTDESAPSSTNITRDAAFSDRVFGVLSRAWGRLAQQQKDLIADRLNAVSCVPTRTGFKTPKESYFVDVDLFPDLAIIDFPNLPIKGQSRTMLAALGVRSHVDLQLVFSRLVGQSKWSCYELIRYLVSVKNTLTDHELARLRKTAAFPVAPRGGSANDKSVKIKRVTPDALYEPTAEHEALGVDVLDWGIPWKPHSAEAIFAFSLGVKRLVDVGDLLRLASDPSDAGQRDRAFKYLLSHINQYKGFSATTFADFAFVPAIDSNGKPFMANPTEAFLNPSCSVMGFATVAPLEGDAAAKLKLLKDVPTAKLVEALAQRPPTTVDHAIKQFEYLSTRLPDFFMERTLDKLVSVPFIRVVDTRQSASSSGSTVLVRPSEVFFKPTDDASLELFKVYQRIFLYVDMGRSANAFLEACGVKRQPSTEQLTSLIVGNPRQFLNLAQTTEAYLTQLRIIAASYGNMSGDIKRQMYKSNFLLAGKRVAVKQENAKSLMATLTGGADDYDEDYVMEYDLSQGSDICIVDDPNAYQLFATNIKTAPQEDLLEDFYLRLGAQLLSSLVREAYTTVGQPRSNQPNALALRKLILERLAVFLSERHKSSSSDISLEWLRKEGNFQVLEVPGLNLKRTLRQGQREQTNVQQISAAVIRARGSAVQLYISQSIELDMYEVASALVKTLFKKTRPDEPLLLMTMLTTPLAALKRRGYNVDRILNQQRAERLAHEAQRREEQATLAETNARDTSVRSTSKQEDLRQLQEEDPNHIKAVLESQKGDQLANATKALMERNSNSSRPTSLAETSSSDRRSSFGSSSGLKPSSSIMKSLREKIRRAPQPQTPTAEVTPAADIRDNALRAVAASRPNTSRDVVSQAQRTEVKESADTYCDTTGVNTNLREMGVLAGSGLKVYVDNGVPNGATLISEHNAAFRRFAEQVIVPLGKVFNLPPASLAVFYDRVGPLIAFNRGGSIFFNARFYEAWHDASVLQGDLNEPLISWYHTAAHEIAHNISPNHDSEHEFYFSSICETFLLQFVKILA